MSTDERVTKDLIETLRDGEKGYAQAAERIAETTRADLAVKFQAYSTQRGRFASELEAMAEAYGDDIDESGSLAGALHRGWMGIKDVLAGKDPDGVIEAVNSGESHAVSEFEKALQQDISANLRRVVERQHADIVVAAGDIKVLDQQLT
jgi:uncharacterized protein (TIGR02284 family)